MPDLITHYYFGEELFKRFNDEVKAKIINYDLYLFATAGPDPFFFYKFLNGKKNEVVRELGNYMHRNKTQEFFISLINQCRDSLNKDILFSYLTGFIAHYALDSLVHPYVFHKTGEYLKTPETLKYRGLHTMLERSIDSYIIRNIYNTVPWKYKISKRALTLKKIPLEIYDDLNKVYGDVFDLIDGAKLVNESLKDQIKFYNFIYDPIGIKQKFFTLIDNGKSGLDYKTFSYYHKELPNLDIFNNNHEVWINPVDVNTESNESFWELFTKATMFANELINVAYESIYTEDGYNLKKLEEHFTNLSYLTGIDCRRIDSHDMKHFNNIFEGDKNA